MKKDLSIRSVICERGITAQSRCVPNTIYGQSVEYAGSSMIHHERW